MMENPDWKDDDDEARLMKDINRKHIGPHELAQRQAMMKRIHDLQNHM